MTEVIVRVLAILMVLGLSAGVVDARAVDAPATAALTFSIDETDEAVDLALVGPTLTPSDEPRGLIALDASETPPRYEHSLFVFRPPRAYAFN